MDYKEIQNLINAVGNSKLTDIDITFPDGTKIIMKKEATSSVNVSQNENVKTIDTKESNVMTNKLEEGNIIKSPMVGTFYLKPSPTSNPFVEIGKTVKQGETLCIIEAMKLMNEIESEFAGKILDILVNDGDTVEYGTPLFRIG